MMRAGEMKTGRYTRIGTLNVVGGDGRVNLGDRVTLGRNVNVGGRTWGGRI